MQTEHFQQNPYPGLRPFDAGDSELFYGRDSHIHAILQKLEQHRFVTVVGNSGSGKSSLIRSGVLPRIARQETRRKIISMRPGHDPLQSLSDQLARNFNALQAEECRELLDQHSLGLVEILRHRLAPGQTLLLLVDQFEEIFRFLPDQGNQLDHPAQKFVDLLLHTARQLEPDIRIILTLRSDFIADCEQIVGLPEALNEGQFLIPRMSKSELADCIEKPALSAGARINPALTQRLIREAGHNPDQLPVLQHALMRTWQVWRKEKDPLQPIEIRHYEATGGMKEALSRHAEEAWHELTETGRNLAPMIFRAITFKAEGERGIRRPMPVDQIAKICRSSVKEIIETVNVFRKEGRGFLMPPHNQSLQAESIVDIAHESLMRRWKRLADWVEDEAESVRFFTRLSENARLYDQNAAGLWRDPDLQLALDWQEKQKPGKAWASLYHDNLDRILLFIEASLQEKVHQRLESQRRQNRLRILTIVILLSLTLLTGWALKERSASARNASLAVKEKEKAEKEKILTQKARLQAEKNQIIAEQQTRIARAQEKIAIAQRLEADLQRTNAQRNLMTASLQADAARSAVAQVEKERAIAVKNAQLAEEARKSADRLTQLALSRNLAIQSRLATEGSFPRSDLKPALCLEAWDMHLKAGGDPEDPDQFLSLLSSLRWLKPASEYERKDFGNSVRSLCYSKDGNWAYVASDDGTLLVLNGIRIWNQPIRYPNPGQLLSQLTLSTEGKGLATVRNEKTWSFYQVSGSQLQKSDETSFSEKINQFIWENESSVWLSSGNDLYHLSLISGKIKVKTVLKLESKINTLAKNKDNDLLLGLEDGSLKNYNTQTGEIQLLQKWDDAIQLICISQNFELAAVVDARGEVELAHTFNWNWKTLTGQNGSVSKIKFSPDGLLLAAGGFDGRVRLWKTNSPEKVPFIVQEHSSWIYDLDFSPDSYTLLTGSRDQSIRLTPTSTLEMYEALLRAKARRMTPMERELYIGN